MKILYFGAQSGFVALISVIILSVVLIILSVSLSTASFFSRFNVADGEYKQRSSSLSEACVAAALLKLAQNPSYGGGETVSVGSDDCQIVSVAFFTTRYIIKSKAVFPKGAPDQAVTNIQAVVDSGSYSVISWQELPAL